jgi:hypothetical protein
MQERSPKCVRRNQTLLEETLKSNTPASECPQMQVEGKLINIRFFRFISDAKIDSGAFGKVLVGRSKTGGRLDLNFEFNLYKV